MTSAAPDPRMSVTTKGAREVALQVQQRFPRYRADFAAPPGGQPAATSNAVTLRVSRLNSTPIRWIGCPRPRYFAA